MEHALCSRGANRIGGLAFTTMTASGTVRFTEQQTASCGKGEIEEAAESHGDSVCGIGCSCCMKMVPWWPFKFAMQSRFVVFEQSKPLQIIPSYSYDQLVLESI